MLVSCQLDRLLAQFFTPDEVCVVQGDAAVASAFAALPFDHLVFTGSTAVGRKVAQAAAANLTPTTLELGGKSPCIIDADCRLEDAALKIAHGKLLNAGQTCIAPDYVLVPRGSESAFVTRMNERAKALGCRQFVFHNTHGLPDNGRENLSSPVELAYLAGVLMDVPEIMRWTTVRRDAIREDKKILYLDTTNSLLGRCPGVNGMKTGVTNKAGHCITLTCDRDGRRLAVVVMGAANSKSRDALARFVRVADVQEL